MSTSVLQKTYLLSLDQKVCYCKINNLKVLIIYKNNENNEISFCRQREYILIPDFINYEKKENLIFFSSTISFLKQFSTFLNSFSFYLKSFEKKIRKKILLTGLGFKVNFSKDLESLEFKIGLSHIVSLKIPKKYLNIFLIKNTIIVEGINKVQIGNFLKKLKNLKMPGAYTGKGFWYKNEKRVLKPVKKT